MADEHIHLPNSRTPPGLPAQTPGANHDAAPRSILSHVREYIWPKAPPHPPHKGEGTREIVETVVFVVVLVLLLKSFVAEAFVIPTGSMADTLWGYQKVIACPQCTHEFPVNSSHEADPQDGFSVPVVYCMCQNCQKAIHLINPQRDGRQPDPRAGDEVLDPGSNSGDRVLVVKYLYDFERPDRFDVVVFKYPTAPQQNWVQMNYIKRLVGHGGETIGIWYGDLYKWDGFQPPRYEPSPDSRNLWVPRYMHEDDARSRLEEGNGFEILRKSPDKILALRRLVYDNDQPARDLEGVLPPRWSGEDDAGSWKRIEGHGFRRTAPDTDRLDWLRYHHIVRHHGDRPQLITDLLGYNTYFPNKNRDPVHKNPVTGQLTIPELPRNWVPSPPNWAGDLILECEVNVEAGQGDLVLELSRGVDRFRARWELDSGKCTLLRLKRPHESATPPAEDDFEPLDRERGVAQTALKGTGTHRLRFANVDAQLVVWVDGKLAFGDGITYSPPQKQGPYPNDLQPASIGVKGGTVSVRHLKLWRDTYYTTRPGQADGSPEEDDWGDPKKWQSLRQLAGKTLYIQPGHYLCLGDNSMESSDSRAWGAVPQRLMLGRALAVYYPFYFPWWPLKSPVNRIGPIE
jgi:signal peptidase I